MSSRMEPLLRCLYGPWTDNPCGAACGPSEGGRERPTTTVIDRYGVVPRAPQGRSEASDVPISILGWTSGKMGCFWRVKPFYRPLTSSGTASPGPPWGRGPSVGRQAASESASGLMRRNTFDTAALVRSSLLGSRCV